MRNCNLKPYEGLSCPFLKISNIANLSLPHIANVVSKVTDVPVMHIKKSLRTRQFSDARKIFMSIARKHGKYSTVQIGRYLDLDHSTVIYNTDSANDLVEYDKQFSKTYYKVLESLRGF
ncbi:MAG: hypothetical protein IE931_05695 [Sphingobacteriales bacterium]|nr:hypothetical protein [Sphingobacteriales bacterium]